MLVAAAVEVLLQQLEVEVAAEAEDLANEETALVAAIVEKEAERTLKVVASSTAAAAAAAAAVAMGSAQAAVHASDLAAIVLLPTLEARACSAPI